VKSIRVLHVLIFILLLATVAQAREYDAARIQMIEAERRMREQRVLGRQCNPQNNCFEFLTSLETDENSPRYFGAIEAAAPTCLREVNNSQSQISSRFRNADDLRQFLSTAYPEIGSYAAQQAERCVVSDAGDASARVRVSKFFNNLLRFNEAATRAVEEIAAINSTLGLSNSTNLNCNFRGNESVNQAKRRCEEIKSSCSSATSQIARYAQQSQQDEPTYQALSDQLTQVTRTCNLLRSKYQNNRNSVSATNPERRICTQELVIRTFEERCTNYSWREVQQLDSCANAIERINTAKGEIASRNPWFRSANYFELRRTKSVSESITAQLNINKAELTTKLGEFAGAAKCILGTESADNCDITSYRETLAQTPDIDETYTSDTRRNGAMVYLRTQSCVEESIANVNGRTSIINNFAVDAGLTILTAGFGAGARAAMAAGRTVSTGARVGLAASLGGDAYYAAQSYRDVVNSCTQQVQRLESLQRSPAAQRCPGLNSASAQAELEYTNCATSAAIAALDSLPFFPAIPSLRTAIASARGTQAELRGVSSATRPSSALESLSVPLDRTGDIGGGARTSGLGSRAIYTANLPESALPYSTSIRDSTGSAVRPRNSLADYAPPGTRVEITDTLLASREQNGSAGLVRLGYVSGADGERIPVAVKTYYPSSSVSPQELERTMLDEARSAELCSELGICGRMRGVFRDSNGRWNIAMDVARGDFNGPVNARSFEDLETIISRLRGAGVRGVSDLQLFRSPEGRLMMIDPDAISLNRAAGPLSPQDIPFGYTSARTSVVRDAAASDGLTYLETLRRSDRAAWDALLANLSEVSTRDPQIRQKYGSYMLRFGYETAD
jgi:hypothetical protein